MKPKIWIYDIEIYPNLFCVTFWDNNANEKLVFELSERKDDSDKLYDFLIKDATKYLVGFNSIGYDDKILLEFLRSLSFVYPMPSLKQSRFTLKKVDYLFKCSKSIINGEELKRNINIKQSWNSIDLMLIHRFHKLGIGLKQVGVTLKCAKIQDLPYAYDKVLTNEEIDEVIKYNANDVFITYKLYKASIEELNLRSSISKAYGVNVLNSSRSNIADKIVTKYIREATGYSYEELKSLTDDKTEISLNSIISPLVDFKHPTLVKVLDTLRSSVISSENDKFEHSFIFDDSKYTLALGGLHSDNPPNIYKTKDNQKILDFDFSSYYPSLMINLEVEPPQLKNVFLPIVKQLTQERLQAKKDGNSLKANTLKITINSIKLRI